MLNESSICVYTFVFEKIILKFKTWYSSLEFFFKLYLIRLFVSYILLASSTHKFIFFNIAN